MLKINLKDTVFCKIEGLRHLLSELDLEEAPEGIALCIRQGDALSLSFEQDHVCVCGAKPVEIFRALCLFKGHHDEIGFTIREKAAFLKNGVMFDCSRNAVLHLKTLKYLLERMALMGLNMAMMYTEETYEVEDEPYFGYLRGRYSQQELRELDDFADMLGIELIPCIQTLSHLERALHWPCYGDVRDTAATLLVDEEKTYRLIEKLIQNASAPYRSRRIHLGMDEAFDLGDGEYRRRNGATPRMKIMRSHVARVRKICLQNGLEPMMWSDMHFNNAFGGYYAGIEKGSFSKEEMDSVFKDVQLVYWDYYHEQKRDYERMLTLHAQLGAPVLFAGGIWIWSGGVPDYTRTFNTTVPALTACREQGVREVFATAWGDDGAETSALTILLGMQLYAEMDYTGTVDRLDERLYQSVGARAEDYTAFTRMDYFPGVQAADGYINIHKALLFEDPLIPMFEADFAGLDMAGHYEEIEKELFRRARQQVPVVAVFSRFYAKMAHALALKACYRDAAVTCIGANDREGAPAVCAMADQNIQALEALRKEWRDLWMGTNKPFGFEVIDTRLGGVIARFESARERFTDFAAGRITDIPELSCEKLPVLRRADGKLMPAYLWSGIVSASRIAGL